jgi:hypothetical protein
MGYNWQSSLNPATMPVSKSKVANKEILMRRRFMTVAGIALMTAGLLLVPSAKAGTAFRIGCYAAPSGDPLLDPQVISIPDEVDHLKFYIDLCLSLGGNPRVDGGFFR